MLSGAQQGSDVRRAIEGELSEPPEEDVTVEPEIDEISTWEVVIYSGNDVFEQEVPLPLDEDGLTEEQALKAEEDAAKAEEEAALVEREAQLIEREAALNAREAEMNKQPAAVDTPVLKSGATKPETIETTTAPEPTEATKQPDAEVEENPQPEEKTQAVKKDTDKKVWNGAVKRFLTGA